MKKTDRSFPPLVSSSLPLPIALRSAAPFYSLPPLSSIVLLVPFVKAGTTADIYRFIFGWQEQVARQWTRDAKALATEQRVSALPPGVVLTTVLILCHDEPGHMVGRREQSISVKRRALAFWVENRTRKATRRNLLFLEECAVGPRGGYLLNQWNF